MKRSIAFMVLMIFLCPAAQSEVSREEYYYRAVLHEGGLFKKQELGKKLGLLRTKEARRLLLKLLEEDSYWNRLGTVEGLLALGDSSLGPVLADRFFSDHMIDDELGKGMKAGMGLYFDALTAKYDTLTRDNQRDKLLELVASSRIARGQSFLKKIIEDPEASRRDVAFRCLARYYPRGNYNYVRERVSQSTFREPALQYITKHGVESDLQLFLSVISARETPAHVAIAYKAAARWGDPNLKRRIFLAALKEENDLFIILRLLMAGVYTYADGTVERGEFSNYLFAGPIYLPGGTDESKVEIGRVNRVNSSTREIEIAVNQGRGLKVLRMSQKVFLEVRGVMAALQVTFPMGASARCRMIGQTQMYAGDVQKGMPVYKMVSGIKRGNDTFLFPNGNKYVGEHSGNRMHGKGEFLWTNGNRYVGEYSNSMRHGKGTIHWYHGQMYTGDWKNGKLDGNGLYRYKDGTRYEGEFRNGRIEGYGTKYHSNGRVMQKGRWKNWDYMGK